MARKRKSSSQEQASGRTVILRYVLWAVLMGAWLLIAASLVSYHPADPPAHDVAIHNQPVKNWIGRAGAIIAYQSYRLIGPGVWLAMLGVASWLVLLAVGRRLNQVVLRGLGLVLMTVAASAMIGLCAPTVITGTEPGMPVSGGLLALYINDHLAGRFAMTGTMVILGVAFWIGAILAADRLMLSLVRTTGGTVIRLLHLPRPTIRMPKLKWPFTGRKSDGVSSSRDIPVRSSRSRRREAADHMIDEDAGGLGATESFNPEEHQKQSDEAPPPEEEGEAADAPGAYLAEKKRKFDPEELRAKMQKLPINFAPRAAKSSNVPPPREVDFSGYKFPGLDLLEEPESNFTEEMERIVRDQAVELESALRQYNIEGEVVGIDSGPVITLFEVRLAPGTKVSRLNAVHSDLARALRAQNIRIVPNMAGKDTVGIEVPNLKKERVRLKELISVRPELVEKMKLPMFLGKDASGNPLIQDLASMPHMLIAGTTGSGKSVCMNSIIMSFLYTRRPDELKLVLVDPKMVEMSLFKDVPHLMCPVVTEMSKAAAILEWAVTKMDERYELLAEAGVRDIANYNKLEWEELKERMQPANEEEEARIPKKLPYIVFVVDELADLMMTNKEVEGSIVRIAQKARAIGIHMILATQRPQANVVTGLIKSNMPSRIAFKVASGMDSRIVLDQKGGELLLGQGDMLYLSPRSSKLTRAQGTLVDDVEIRMTVKFLKEIADQNFEPQLVQIKSAMAATEGESETERDPLFEDAVQVVLETRRGSVSLLQRRLTIGYSRASRLIEQIAEAGIIGEYKGSQAREVNISVEEWEAMKAQAEADADAAESRGTLYEQSDEIENDCNEVENGEYEDEEDEEDEEDGVPNEYADEYRG